MTEEIDQLQLEKNLINAVKEYPEIYEKTNMNYQNKLCDKMSWLGISEKLRISTTKCCNMWYSMLQIFLYFARLESKGINTPEALTWPHIKAFKEMQPLLVTKYVDMLTLKSNGKSHVNVKLFLLNALLKEMELHKKELMIANISRIHRQEIWNKIANNLNGMSKSIPLPVFFWQKVWWDLKRRARLRKQLEMKGVLVKCGANSLSQDMRILQICGISPSENNSEYIRQKLQSCVEIDGDVDDNTCDSCSTLTMTDFSCEKCSNAVGVCMCEICSKNSASICCNVSQWSSVAKRMIPLRWRTNKKILICKACHSAMNKKASLQWKVCRFCAQESTNLENFLSNAYQQVMDIFHGATRIKFSLEDGLPSFICLTCKDQLLGFGKLFSNFVASQTKLRDIYAKVFIGETRKRPSTSEDLSTLAESSGVTAPKQARVRSVPTSTATSSASAVDNMNLNNAAIPTNMGPIPITHVSNAMPGHVGAARRNSCPFLPNANSAQQNCSQDPIAGSHFVINDVANAVQTNGSVKPVNSMAEANPNPPPWNSNRTQPNLRPSTTVGQFVITEVTDSNQTDGSVAPAQNLNGPSTTSNSEATMISTQSPRLIGNQPQNHANGTRGTCKSARPYQRVMPKPCTPSTSSNSILSELLNRPAIRINAGGSLQTTQQPSSPSAGEAKKPPQRRMTIHNLSAAETGKPTAPWPLILKKGTKKPPQRRLTIHNLAVPSPADSAVTYRSNTTQPEVQTFHTSSSSQSKMVAKNPTRRYYVALKSGESPAPTRTTAPKTPPPKNTPALTKTPAPKTQPLNKAATPKTPAPREASAPTETPAPPKTPALPKTPASRKTPATTITTAPKTLLPNKTPPPNKTPTLNPPPRRMTMHHFSAANCATQDTPQRAVQIRPITSSSQTEAAAAADEKPRPYYDASKNSKDTHSSAERSVPIRQRRKTIHHSLTAISPELRQVPPRVIETIVIRDDTPPREEPPLPTTSSSQRSNPKPEKAASKKITPRKPPALRKTAVASTSHQLPRTPSPDIIVIPDDSPPRKSHQPQPRYLPRYESNALFRPNPSEPLLKTEIALHASLLIDDDDEPEPISSQEDLHVDDSSLELMTPSALINFAIQKAYNLYSTKPKPVPQRMSSTVGSSPQTATSNQELSIDDRRSLRSGSKNVPPKTAEAENLRYYRRAK